MRDSDGSDQWHGRTVIGSDGEKVGKLEQVYEDPATGNPEWATVSSGLLQKTTHFLPLAGAQRHDDDVQVAVTKAQVKDSPEFADDDELSEAEERLLFEHYGIAYPPAQAPAAGSDRVDPASVPSQPEAPSPEQSPGGRRRLRRYIVTEVITAVPASDEGTEIPDRTRPER